MARAFEEKLAEYRTRKAETTAAAMNASSSSEVIPVNDANSHDNTKPLSSFFIVPEFCSKRLEAMKRTRMVRALSSLNEGSRVKVLAVRFACWLFLWTIFIQLEFGAIFFLVSLICFIYMNTRTDTKSHNEPSAYSVFNPNCERIAGTFTAEQFENQLRTGSLT